MTLERAIELWIQCEQWVPGVPISDPRQEAMLVLAQAYIKALGETDLPDGLAFEHDCPRCGQHGVDITTCEADRRAWTCGRCRHYWTGGKKGRDYTVYQTRDAWYICPRCSRRGVEVDMSGDRLGWACRCGHRWTSEKGAK